MMARGEIGKKNLLFILPLDSGGQFEAGDRNGQTVSGERGGRAEGAALANPSRRRFRMVSGPAVRRVA